MKCTSETAVEKCAGILGRGVRSRNGISSPLIFGADVADAVSTPSTLALRTLIQLNPKSYAKYIHLLAQSLPEIHSSSAKAEIIWLVGEYTSQLGGRAPDVLRIALQDFTDQVIIPRKPSDFRMTTSNIRLSHWPQKYMRYTFRIHLQTSIPWIHN